MCDSNNSCSKALYKIWTIVFLLSNMKCFFFTKAKTSATFFFNLLYHCLKSYKYYRQQDRLILEPQDESYEKNAVSKANRLGNLNQKQN